MSKAGAQLTLWRIRSQLLYYYKHHGALATWLVAQPESLWHRLRAWKNAAATDEGGKAKAEESRTMVKLFKQAWRDTQGGRLSPPRPW